MAANKYTKSYIVAVKKTQLERATKFVPKFGGPYTGAQYG